MDEFTAWTEEEAKQRICHEAIIPHISRVTAPDIEHAPPCLASGCMAWQWSARQNLTGPHRKFKTPDEEDAFLAEPDSDKWVRVIMNDRNGTVTYRQLGPPRGYCERLRKR